MSEALTLSDIAREIGHPSFAIPAESVHVCPSTKLTTRRWAKSVAKCAAKVATRLIVVHFPPNWLSEKHFWNNI